MKKPMLLSIVAIGLASFPVLAQDLMLPSGPPSNASEQRLQDMVNAQIEFNRSRGIRSSDDVRRDQRYKRRERTDQRWERDDRRSWERAKQWRDRSWDGQ